MVFFLLRWVVGLRKYGSYLSTRNMTSVSPIMLFAQEKCDPNSACSLIIVSPIVVFARVEYDSDDSSVVCCLLYSYGSIVK